MRTIARMHGRVKDATRNQFEYWLCLDLTKRSHIDLQEIGSAIVAAIFSGRACGQASCVDSRLAGAARDAKVAFELHRQLYDDEISCAAFVDKISQIDERVGSRKDKLLNILMDLMPRARADSKV